RGGKRSLSRNSRLTIPIRFLLMGCLAIALVAVELRANAQTASDPPSKATGATAPGTAAKRETDKSAAKGASESQKKGSTDQKKANPDSTASGKTPPVKDATKAASSKGPASAKTDKSAAPKSAAAKTAVAAAHHANTGVAPEPAPPPGVSAADV